MKKCIAVLAPRPKANREGNLIGPLNFHALDELLELGPVQETDYCFIGLAMWGKQWLRKDLFGLKFGPPAYEKAEAIRRCCRGRVKRRRARGKCIPLEASVPAVNVSPWRWRSPR